MLGTALEHLYPYTGKGFSTRMLKGADAAVLATAQQLGLHVQMLPMWQADWKRLDLWSC